MKRAMDPHAFRNVVLSCLFSFLSGFLYSLGVFSTAVEEAAIPSGSLNDVWSAGMALLSAFSIPSMFYGGIFLSQGPDSTDSDGVSMSMTSRVRLIAAGTSLSYAFLPLGAYGVSISSPILIQFCFISSGIGFGLIYLLPMELLAAWVPYRPGLAIGFGQMMFGLGSIVSSSIFEHLLQNYSVSNALYIAAAIMALPTAAATPFLQWPQDDLHGSNDISESESLLKQATPLSWRQLSHTPSFWMYLTTNFSLQIGYAFIAYFFKIGQSFDKDVSTLVPSFQVATVVATLSRPLTGALIDVFKTEEGFFSLGSKNVIIMLFVVQIFSSLVLIPISWNKSYGGFAFFSGTILVVFAAGSCCAPLLAREQFGAVNSSIVFGTGGSLSMGLGEIVAVLLMAAVERSSAKIDSPKAYQRFYVLSVLWSICGLGISMLLREQNFDDDSKKGSLKASKPSYSETAASDAYAP